MATHGAFVAADVQGNIRVDTTRDSFFSLDRLAIFLKASPLDLAIVLNLDGGSIACQGVRLAGFKREVCGRHEVQIEDGLAKMLPPLWMVRDSPMPIVLAACKNMQQ